MNMLRRLVAFDGALAWSMALFSFSFAWALLGYVMGKSAAQMVSGDYDYPLSHGFLSSMLLYWYNEVFSHLTTYDPPGIRCDCSLLC